MGVAKHRKHILKTERIAHAGAHCAQNLVRDRLCGQTGRHLEQLLERDAMPYCLSRLLSRLHRERSVVGQRDEYVEVLVGRTAPAGRLVDGEDAEQMPVGVAQRHEERVLGVPRVGAAARRDRRDVARTVVDCVQSNSPAATT